MQSHRFCPVQQAVSKPFSDLFNDIKPTFKEESNIQTINPSGLSAASKYVCENGSKDESDEEEQVKKKKEEENRNIFDFFDDEEDL